MDADDVTIPVKHSRWKPFLFQIIGSGIVFSTMYWGVKFVPPGAPHGIPGLLAIFGSYIFLFGSIVAAIGLAFRPAVLAKFVIVISAMTSTVGIFAYIVEFVGNIINAGAIFGIFTCLAGGVTVTISHLLHQDRNSTPLSSIGKLLIAFGCAIAALGFSWKFFDF